MPNTRKGRRLQKRRTFVSRKKGGSLANNFEGATRALLQHVQRKGTNLNFSGPNKAKLNEYKQQYRAFLTGVKDKSAIDVGASTPILPAQPGNNIAGGKTRRKQRGGKEKTKSGWIIDENATNDTQKYYYYSGGDKVFYDPKTDFKSLYNPTSDTFPPVLTPAIYYQTVRGILRGNVLSNEYNPESVLGKTGRFFGRTKRKAADATVSGITKAASATASGIGKGYDAIQSTLPTFSTSEEIALRKAANAFAKNIVDSKVSFESQEFIERDTYKALSNAMHTYLQSRINKIPVTAAAAAAAAASGNGSAGQ